MIEYRLSKKKQDTLQVWSGVHQDTPRRHLDTRRTKRHPKNILNNGRSDTKGLPDHINRWQPTWDKIQEGHLLMWSGSPFVSDRPLLRIFLVCLFVLLVSRCLLGISWWTLLRTCRVSCFFLLNRYSIILFQSVFDHIISLDYLWILILSFSSPIS